MNRTRLAQLTAVLGAAVLLVLALAVARTGTTTVAGPSLDPIATEGPAESGSPADEGSEADGEPDAGDTPVIGPTAIDPAEPPAPAGGGTTDAPGAEPPPGTGPLPPRESGDPFAPRTATGETGTSPPPTAPPSEPAPSEPASSESQSEPAGAPSGEDAPSPTAPETGSPEAEGPETEGPEAAPPAAEPRRSETTGPTSPSRPQVDARPETYRVVSGDNLWDIVESFLGSRAGNAEVVVAVEELYELNRAVIGEDPDLIFPGQVFELPAW